MNFSSAITYLGDSSDWRDGSVSSGVIDLIFKKDKILWRIVIKIIKLKTNFSELFKVCAIS